MHVQLDKQSKPEILTNQVSLNAALIGARKAPTEFEAQRVILPQANKNHFVFYNTQRKRFERAEASFIVFIVVDTTSGAISQTFSAA